MRLQDPGAPARWRGSRSSRPSSRTWRRELEPRLAAELPVVSAASTFRMEADVPLLIPPVNAAHAGLVGRAAGAGLARVGGAHPELHGHRAGGGSRAARRALRCPVGDDDLAPGGVGRGALARSGRARRPRQRRPLHREGRGQGRGGDAEDPRALALRHRAVEPAPVKLSATCTRVAVQDGHTETVSIGLGRRASLDEVRDALRSWEGSPEARDLPSSAPRWIEVLEAPDRPQPRLDRETHGGMATIVGRLREDGVLENGVKLVLVSHNTKMGAAKGAVLVAELMRARGFLAR